MGALLFYISPAGWHLSGDLMEIGNISIYFHNLRKKIPKRTASAKALMWECAYHVAQSTDWPVELERRGQERNVS